MKSHPRISELLVEEAAFTDLDKPVILASGKELGIYYINAEKLCQDGGAFREHKDDSAAMIQHAVNMTQQHPTFNEVIDTISAEVLANVIHGDRKGVAISGGQTRDWIFSGPVARKLELPHVSLYKQRTGEPDRVEIVYPNGRVKDASSGQSLREFSPVHIVDMLTAGSSCYRIGGDKELGWIPMQRQRGARIDNLLAVVTRCQGGEGRLAELANTNAAGFVAIDEDFLTKYSTNPERALAYLKDPTAWSKQYLKEHGALALLDTWNPEGGKLERAIKFTEKYADTLHEAGKFNELDAAVREKFGIQLK